MDNPIYRCKFVTDFRGALIYGLRLYPSNLINVIVAKGKSSATFLNSCSKITVSFQTFICHTFCSIMYRFVSLIGSTQGLLVSSVLRFFVFFKNRESP